MTEKDLDALMEAVSSRLTERKRTYFTDDVRRRLQGVLDDLDPRLVIRPRDKAKTPYVLFHAVLRGAEGTHIFGLYAYADHCKLEIIGLAGYSADAFFYRELPDQRPDLYECLVPRNEGRLTKQQRRIAVNLTSPDVDSRVAAFQEAVGLFLDSLRSASTTMPASHRHLRDDLKQLQTNEPTPASDEEDARRRSVRSIVDRQGQGRFRQGVLRAYSSRCALSNYDAVPALEAAHIDPYMGDHTNTITNGILLRADIHTLMDLGLLTFAVHQDRPPTVILHPDLVGSSYDCPEMRTLRLPADTRHHPDRERLVRHRRRAGL